MKGKLGGIAAAVIVTAIVMQAEHESPGATQRGVQQGRQIVTPIVQEGVGVVGDGVIVARQELERQGVNPGALLTTPSTVPSAGLPDINPNEVGN
jgi:hypothetical protein